MCSNCAHAESEGKTIMTITLARLLWRGRGALTRYFYVSSFLIIAQRCNNAKAEEIEEDLWPPPHELDL